ncbi:MAG: sodium/proline symporter [Pleurocapsa minor HA4230-MV1]|jgi:sodium/proline symporter|nr:sodium/proline symporter [Pleurocapsa minor HA4230-MV1]
MANQLSIAVAFIGFLVLIVFVGIYSSSYKQSTTADYLLASRDVNPWLTALSAMSTGQSGALFLGQVGFAYKIGVSAIWLTIGWAIGDYLAWLFFFKRLREISEDTSSDTVSDFLAQKTLGNRWISIASGIIILAFLGSYAAAQLVAGSKALNVVFDWNYYLGIVLGVVIVIVYCFSGGVRAEIWTDAVQGVVMIGSLLLLLVVAIISGGGFGEIWTQLNAIDTQLVNFSPTNLPLGFIPFFVGWIAAGFGVIGQPHILTRAMAIDSPENVKLALNIKIIASLITSFSALGIGLVSRVVLPDLLTNGDPELALFYLAEDLLPSFFVGIMLAGVFAATMSTADSQILCCSAALTQDIAPQFAKSYRMVKLGTLTVAAIVMSIALAGDDNVFLLVTSSWSALAAGLGPLILVRIRQLPITTPVALLMMIVGIVVAIAWSSVFKWSNLIYEVVPGMTAGFIVYAIAQLFERKLLRK